MKDSLVSKITNWHRRYIRKSVITVPAEVIIELFTEGVVDISVVLGIMQRDKQQKKLFRKCGTWLG